MATRAGRSSSVGQGGQALGLGADAGADVGVPALEVDVHPAAYAGDGPSVSRSAAASELSTSDRRLIARRR